MFCPYCTSSGFVPKNKIFHSARRAQAHIAKCRPIIEPGNRPIAERNAHSIIPVETREELGALVKIMSFAKSESPQASFQIGDIYHLKKVKWPYALYILVRDDQQVLGYTNFYLNYSDKIPMANSTQTYIRRENRGKGYGKFLLEEAIKHVCNRFHLLYIYADYLSTDAGQGVWSSLPFPHSGRLIDVSQFTWTMNDQSVLQKYCDILSMEKSSKDFKESAKRLRNMMASKELEKD
jgi:GNAT superfamily N-acetyltransferase